MPVDPSWKRPLPQLLHLEPAGEDCFGALLDGFGGVTLGCAARAAALTCEGRALDWLHFAFLRAVPPDSKAKLRVERVRDGRRFAHRRVEVRIGDRLACEAMCSFVAPGHGIDFQEPTIDEVPAPATLTPELEIARAEGWNPDEDGPIGGPIEWRYDGIPWRDPTPGTPSRYRAWARVREPLQDTLDLRAAALAYLCDYHSHFPVARRMGGPFEPIGFTSLDQVMWVHRDLAWDDWWLLDSEADVAHAGRALVRALSAPHLERIELPREARRELRRLEAPRRHLFRRATARPRVALVQAPTFIVGDTESVRRTAVDRVLAPTFDAERSVYVELPCDDVMRLAPDDVAGAGRIDFPGHATDDDGVVAWRAAHGGTVAHGSPRGSEWTPEQPAAEARVEAVADARFSKSMERMEVDVTGLGEGFLLLAEPVALHEGWHAKLDGEDTPLLRADGAATLVRLPASARRLELDYRTPHLETGAWISASTLALVLALLAWEHRRAAALR